MHALKLSRALSNVTLTVFRHGRTVFPLAPLLQHHTWQCQVAFNNCLQRCTLVNRPTGLPWDYMSTSVTPFSTQASDGSDKEQDSAENVKKPKVKQDPKARKTVSNVGRKIHHRRLLLLSETGENLGTFHRADVIRMMEEKQMKLVVVNENADPPVFRLMSGKQIHEEQMKLREKTKNKSGPVQVKELTLSSDIGGGDLKTKLRQISPWLEKKHHIRITLRARGHTVEGGTQPLDKSLEAMLLKLDVPFGYVSPTRLIKDGRAASCIIRPPSEKEKRANLATSASLETSAKSTDTLSTTSATVEESAEYDVQQK